MKSYTQLRNTYGVDTKSTASANLTQGDEWMNDFHRRLLSIADWPFLHRPRTITTFDPDSTFTAVAATDLCTAAGTIQTFTGTPVEFTTTGTLPAGLSTSTRYYLIYDGTTTFKVATTLANALAGTAIDITDTGTGTHTVVVKTSFQPLPYDVDLVESVAVEVDDYTYNPKPAPNKRFWDQLNHTTQESDSPEYWYVEEGKIGLWPKPANDGNFIRMQCKIKATDLNVADYTTGNIDIITNGSVAVTGAGTPAWTTPMAGRWLRVTHSNTAASSGDGQWYEIVAVASSTSIMLARPYGGRSLTTGAGAAYTIGQMPLLPGAYSDLLEQYAAYRYWSKEKDSRANQFKEMLQDGLSSLFTSFGINDLSMVVDEGDDSYIINPNLTIKL